MEIVIENFLKKCREISHCETFGCFNCNTTYCKKECKKREVTLDELEKMLYNELQKER